jgi:hypothetical protein
MSRGFIYVASVNHLYYELALHSCATLRDYYPEAKVTLFTHESFVEDRARELFDDIITNIPIHTRAKMWAMARTPYEETVYIDCDSIIASKDIRKIHDFLQECDLFCGDNRDYTVSKFSLTTIDKAGKFEVKHHGSMWGYKKSDLTIEFMQTWFDEYLKQIEGPWKYDSFADSFWQQFDMFTLWRMITNHFDEGFAKFQDLKLKILPTRWNCSGQTLKHHLDGPKVIIQIDRNTLSKTSSRWWNEIMERRKNVRYSIDKSKAKSSSFEYD